MTESIVSSHLRNPGKAITLPNRTWARLSPDPAFVEKLRIVIEDLTTPTVDRVPPFLRIFDADPQWRRYLFGRQRPETQVEAMSWYWRFLLMMTLVRKLSWTCKFKESGLSTILVQFHPRIKGRGSASSPRIKCSKTAIVYDSHSVTASFANSAAQAAILAVMVPAAGSSGIRR